MDMMLYRSEAYEELRYLEENLHHLTLGISDVTIDEVPRCYQLHTTGISRWFSRLFHRVAQAITCYHEQHQDKD